MSLPRLAVSRCLLGERVRYDGGHKLARGLVGRLVRDFTLVPVCPEVEAGLGLPRESAHVGGNPLMPRFVGNFTERDWTFRLMGWACERLAAFELRPVLGYVFKSGSPSCAARRMVPVLGPGGTPCGRSLGLFARAFRERFPAVPLSDELELADPGELERFVARVLARVPAGNR